MRKGWLLSLALLALAQGQETVSILLLRPMEDERIERSIANGVVLAIEEANKRGGYLGKPFELILRNAPETSFEEGVWAVLRPVGENTPHFALRVFDDSNATCRALAHRIHIGLGLRRVALLRSLGRYGESGAAGFETASQQLGFSVTIEQTYPSGAQDFHRQLRAIEDAKADGIVIWGDAPEAALVLKQMRVLGMKQRVFGGTRAYSEELLATAGAAAEGVEVVSPYDPARDDPRWLAFRASFQKRFGRQPDVIASLSFDAANLLLRAIREPGSMAPSAGAAPVFFATVHDGGASFRRYRVEPVYAQTGDSEPAYNGPELGDLAGSPLRIALFGPEADRIADSLAPLVNRYGGRFALVAISSEAPWGKASSALVSAIYDTQALAVVAVGRNESHLAEQLSVKAFVPVVAISADRALTSFNFPWLFRLPAGTEIEDALRQVLDAAALSGANRGKLRGILAASGRFQPFKR